MRVQRDNTQSGQKKDKRFKGEGGQKAALTEGQMGQVAQWRYTTWTSLRSHSVGMYGISRRSREGSSSSESCIKF